MKHRYTKERKREWAEFAYKYREDLRIAAEKDPRPYSSKGLTAEQAQIVKLARLELGYSEKTQDVDVWICSQKTLKTLEI